MRYHPSTPLHFPEYDRTRPAQRRALFDRENPKKAERRRTLEEHRCYPFGERGIKLRDLPAGSRVPQIIHQHQWEGFIRTRTTFCAPVVAEFYASMEPAVYHDRCVVKMRGIDVRISPADIDAYYHAPRRAELSMTYGLSPHDAFQENMSPLIAASLRRNGYEGWNNTNNTILKSEMHTDIAFLMLFIKASLKPSTHNTTADSQVAEVLYSLQNNMPMDIGHIIWMEILDAGMTLSGVLPFPCLITHFCRQAGVPIGALTRTKGDFGKSQYKHQVTAATKLEARRRNDPSNLVRNLAVPISDSSSESAADSSSESDPEYAPAAPPAPYQHSEDTPLYMRHWMDHVTTRMDGMNTEMMGSFRQVNHRLDRQSGQLQSIETYLAQGGYQPYEGPSQQQRRVRGRPSGGASSSRQ